MRWDRPTATIPPAKATQDHFTRRRILQNQSAMGPCAATCSAAYCPMPGSEHDWTVNCVTSQFIKMPARSAAGPILERRAGRVLPPNPGIITLADFDCTVPRQLCLFNGPNARTVLRCHKSENVHVRIAFISCGWDCVQTIPIVRLKTDNWNCGLRNPRRHDLKAMRMCKFCAFMAAQTVPSVGPLKRQSCGGTVQSKSGE